jgi:hypothetical protein
MSAAGDRVSIEHYGGGIIATAQSQGKERINGFSLFEPVKP